MSLTLVKGGVSNTIGSSDTFTLRDVSVSNGVTTDKNVTSCSYNGNNVWTKVTSVTLTFIEDKGESWGSWAYNTRTVNAGTKLYYTFSNSSSTLGTSKMYVRVGSSSGTIINTYTAKTNSELGDITGRASVYYSIVAGTNTTTSPYTVNSSVNIGVGVESSLTLCCFVGNTKITMADGTYKLIKDIVVGDKVLSCNIKRNELVLDTTYVKEIVVKDTITTYADVIFSDGTSVTMNWYHPLYTKNGWHSITNFENYDTLVIGDEIKTQNGWKAITDIKLYEKEPELMYNLDVEHEPEDDEDIDNYFANDSLAHNKVC